jgi:Na+-transporting methylmalonyl-CoA/oxaloacetate decarboxylase gamma subunit
MDSDKWAFGLTMMVIGMGGTFLTLWILSLVMDLLKKIFPLPHKSSSSQKQS